MLVPLSLVLLAAPLISLLTNAPPIEFLLREGKDASIVTTADSQPQLRLCNERMHKDQAFYQVHFMTTSFSNCAWRK